MQYRARPLITALSLAAGASALAMAVLVPLHAPHAALIEEGNRPQVLIGRDDDNQDNPDYQPAGAVDQS